jgi:hypothetical protein
MFSLRGLPIETEGTLRKRKGKIGAEVKEDGQGGEMNREIDSRQFYLGHVELTRDG